MARVDNIMIPVTVFIVFMAVIPFLAPSDLWFGQEGSGGVKAIDKIIQDISKQGQVNDKLYFDQLDNNIEEAKEKVRDLMAEHEAANP